MPNPQVKQPQKNRILLFAATLLFSTCNASPLYRGTLHSPPTKSPILIQSGTKVALFSVLMRKVAVSNSQGHNWTAFHYPKDYSLFYKGLEQAIQEELHLDILPYRDILNLSIYLDGYFPLREKFYLNPQKLPIIKSAREEELMLRTARRLKVEYFATALLEHSVSKFIMRPLSTTSELYFHLYQKDTGLIYTLHLLDSRPALPYNRKLSFRELIRNYDPIVNQALNQSMESLLKQLHKKLRKDLKNIELRVEHRTEKSP